MYGKAYYLEDFYFNLQFLVIKNTYIYIQFVLSFSHKVRGKYIICLLILLSAGSLLKQDKNSFTKSTG